MLGDHSCVDGYSKSTNMKFKMIMLLAMGSVAFTACRSDRNKYPDGDSLHADSAMDDMATIDRKDSGTSANRTNVDTVMKKSKDTTTKDTIIPIR